MHIGYIIHKHNNDKLTIFSDLSYMHSLPVVR